MVPVSAPSPDASAACECLAGRPRIKRWKMNSQSSVQALRLQVETTPTVLFITVTPGIAR